MRSGAARLVAGVTLLTTGVACQQGPHPMAEVAEANNEFVDEICVCPEVWAALEVPDEAACLATYRLEPSYAARLCWEDAYDTYADSAAPAITCLTQMQRDLTECARLHGCTGDAADDCAQAVERDCPEPPEAFTDAVSECYWAPSWMGS